jgi:hypothetical protein
LRTQAGYKGQTPLVVMPEKVAKDMESTDENVGETIGFVITKIQIGCSRLVLHLPPTLPGLA